MKEHNKRIIITGVETNNKGAELMLYAILQEIERRYPKVVVYVSKKRLGRRLSYVKTNCRVKFIPCEWLEQLLHLKRVFKILHIPFTLLPHVIALGKIDYYFDASGFKFSDQFRAAGAESFFLDSLLSVYKKKGAKVIYLPQAFGPFEYTSTKNTLKVLARNATIIMAREKVSYDHLIGSGLVDAAKLKIFTDFTSLVGGALPDQYSHLIGGICVIPNRQMIDKGKISEKDYLAILKEIVSAASVAGHPVYLLNHDGINDERLCVEIRNQISADVTIVSNLNALEIKGLISSAYLVISSRFHGVASALNSCVPCLATSWSHKYGELFNDYGLNNCILPLNDLKKSTSLLSEFLCPKRNDELRKKLTERLPAIKEETRRMWEYIWTF